jgi:hypothetical protein
MNGEHDRPASHPNISTGGSGRTNLGRVGLTGCVSCLAPTHPGEVIMNRNENIDPSF